MTASNHQDAHLVELCTRALHTFSIKDQAVDHYIAEFLTEHDHSLSCEDETFIVEVFSGCVYYNKLFKVLVDGFYQTDGRSILKSHYNIFVVLGYLIIFRMDEISFKRLRGLVLAQPTVNMIQFFSYLLDDQKINNWVYDRWCEQYDSQFVDQKIIAAFDSGRSELHGVMEALDNVVEHDVSPTLVPRPTVVPEPFDLTEVKPRAIPVPKKIPSVPAFKTVPVTTRKKPIYEKQLRKKREENHDEVQQRLKVANRTRFKCADPELSKKTAVKIERIRQEEDKKLQFNARHVTQERVKVENKPIKMNTAAILREGLIYQKKEKESEEYLTGLLRGDFDQSKFDEWQKKQLAEDQRNKVMNTHYRKMQGQIAREQAILAKKQKEEENRKVAEDVKHDIVTKQEHQMLVRVVEEQRIQELIEEVNRSHVAAQEAKAKTVVENQQVAKKVNAESRELMRRALEEEEKRMIERSETIAQIRALEHLRPERKVMLDHTSTAGHFLFAEMSLAELHERLCGLKDEQLQERERKNGQIKKEKKEKSQAIFDAIAKISMHREEVGRSTVIKAKLREEDLLARRQMIDSDEKLKQLQRKLEMKKKKVSEIERVEVIKQNSAKKINFRGLIREKKELQKNRWKHLENSHQRMAEKQSKLIDNT